MRLPWRIPAVLTACVVLGQIFRQTALVDVATWTAPHGAHLAYPLGHVIFAPLTLLADWLNGGSRRDFLGFALWSIAAYGVLRVAFRRPPASKPVLREAACAALFVAFFAVFIAWAAFLPRPIPRLEVEGGDAVVLDVHSHTAWSHDGRRGFDARANAIWHRRAGFHAAFVTDHNSIDPLNPTRFEGMPNAARLLDGQELSLSGLHLLVLGWPRPIPNTPYNRSWDSTGALIRRLAAIPPSVEGAPFLIASLPEYWSNHWGEELGELVTWGVKGFEIWTTSPKAMEITPAARRAVIARCRLSNVTMFGATDMHGLGYSATVWNVARIPAWRQLDSFSLQRALVNRFKSAGAEGNEVVSVRRWLPETRLGYALAVPVNLAGVLRQAPLLHALALLGWIWLPALVKSRRRPAPTP